MKSELTSSSIVVIFFFTYVINMSAIGDEKWEIGKNLDENWETEKEYNQSNEMREN